jgi:hypothetical protein
MNQFGGTNTELQTVHDNITLWNVELKKKCPYLELRFGYQTVMADETTGTMISHNDNDNFILCLYNNENCISGIGFDIKQNYADINTETQENMQKKRYNKFLIATLIRLLYIFKYNGINTEYIKSYAVNNISLLNLLPYEIKLEWEKPCSFDEKYQKYQNITCKDMTPKPEDKGSLRDLITEFIPTYKIEEEQYYEAQLASKIEIDKQIDEKYKDELDQAEKWYAEARIVERNEKNPETKKKRKALDKARGSILQRIDNEKTAAVLTTINKPKDFPPVTIYLKIDVNKKIATEIWTNLVSDLDTSIICDRRTWV